MVEAARATAEALDATLVNMRFVKPLDETLLLELAADHACFVTIEDHAIAGGAGSAVNELFAARGVRKPMLNLGIPDRFVEHGSREDCLKSIGLDAPGIRASVESWLGAQQQPPRQQHAAGR